VIVVENGSTDKTLECAKKFETSNFRVYSIKEKGVSIARNFGAKKIKDGCDWIIFLDADTLLKNGFLNDLNVFLNKAKNVVVGTTTLLPTNNSLYAKLWFKFYDLMHIILHASLSIQIVKKEVFYKVWYDETLRYTEDWKMIKMAEKYGRFFLFKTKKVYASTRRFEAVGWFRQLFLFAFWGILPEKYKKESRLRGDKMRVLVVNDDGIYARGIRVLANALRTISDVVVVAPDRQKSAAGHSLTINDVLVIKKWKLKRTLTALQLSMAHPRIAYLWA